MWKSVATKRSGDMRLGSTVAAVQILQLYRPETDHLPNTSSCTISDPSSFAFRNDATTCAAMPAALGATVCKYTHGCEYSAGYQMGDKGSANERTAYTFLLLGLTAPERRAPFIKKLRADFKPDKLDLLGHEDLALGLRTPFKEFHFVVTRRWCDRRVGPGSEHYCRCVQYWAL